jgi:hypothetical protein
MTDDRTPDPYGAHDNAEFLAGLTARGLLREDEAAQGLEAMAIHSADPVGLHAQVRHTYTQSLIEHGYLPLPGSATKPPLDAVPARLPEPEKIPPRPWLYGDFLVRGFVSVLAAPGGAGKSAYALAVALSVATGRPLLGERVHRALPAWVLNLEDPLDELDRRLAALLRLHGLGAADVAGRLHLHSGRTRPLCMAMPDDRPGVIRHPDQDAVIAAIKYARIGLLVIDPFVKSHALDENDNRAIDAAATAWAEVAEATAASILLVHHVRKGTTTDIDAARGAKALTDAARAAALLMPMSAEEARQLGVPPSESWRLLRRDDAKANLAPRATKARWFRLETVELGNGTADYPEGDRVAALAPWRPESPFANVSAADCNAALDLIAAGPGQGTRFTASRAAHSRHRWAGNVLMLGLGIGEDQAAAIVSIWLRSGLLVEGEYRDPVHRKPRKGVTVVDAKRPTIPAGEPA